MSSKVIKGAQPGVSQPFSWPVLSPRDASRSQDESHPHEDDYRSPARPEQVERRAGEAHQAGYAEGEAAGRGRPKRRWGRCSNGSRSPWRN